MKLIIIIVCVILFFTFYVIKQNEAIIWRAGYRFKIANDIAKANKKANELRKYLELFKVQYVIRMYENATNYCQTEKECKIIALELFKY